MRVILLVLFLSICASGGLFDGGSFRERLRKAFDKIKTTLNCSKLIAIREKIHGLKEKMVQELTLSDERKAELMERLKHLINIKKDHVQASGDTIDEINAKSGIAELLFQGDIFLSNEQADEIIEDIEDGSNRAKRQAFRDHKYPSTLWSSGVYFYFDPSASQQVRRLLRKAAQLWMKDTCIDFFESNNAKDKIKVFPMEEGLCGSHVGRVGGTQDLSLGAGCEHVSIATHELGHAIGFWHTQSRHDRDQFITVNTQNIKPDWLDQFPRQTSATNENYGLTYDWGGIMHYGASDATKNGKRTMVPKDIKYTETLGSPFISFYELLMINKHYECTKRCSPNNSAKCMMGGFPHPRDCSKCICPSGYGGRLCNERPQGCGKVLQATTSYQTLRDIVGQSSAGMTPREDYTMCNYWIQAPAGSRIEVKLVSFSSGFAVDGCKYGGVEIKTHSDQRLTGYRFCAPEDAGLTLVSNHHVVPIITFNRKYASETVLQYRIVSGRQLIPRW